MLGDSIAAGLGADHRKDTLGGRLAKGIIRDCTGRSTCGWPPSWSSESSALAGQLDDLPATYRADVAVIVVGGNDVTHRIPVTEVDRPSRRRRPAAGPGNRGRGRRLPRPRRPAPRCRRPLRGLGSRASRQLAQAQAEAALAAGAYAVSLMGVVEAVLRDEPRRDVRASTASILARWAAAQRAMLPSVLSRARSPRPGAVRPPGPGARALRVGTAPEAAHQKKSLVTYC